MGQSNPDIVILHLSDLHFGPYLQGVSKIGEWSSFAAPHNFNLLQGMETKVTEIFRKHKERLIVVVTGDMTTAAEPPAYESVNNYLRDNPFVSSKLRVGLELQEIENKMYVVPGNHDIWLYGNWFSRWKRYTYRKDQYFKYFPEQLPNAYPLLINGISLTIYTIDTNRVGGFNPFNFKNVLGKGEVGKQQMGEIQVLHNNLRNGTFQNIPEGFDYNASLKVALMHHHLELPSNIPNDVEQKLLKLDDAKSILTLLCEIGVHIILCGHQHFPYQIPTLQSSNNPNHSIFLSCAGSATQIECKRNSFSCYEIIDNHNGTYNLRVLLYEADAKNNNYFFRESAPSTVTIKS